MSVLVNKDSKIIVQGFTGFYVELGNLDFDVKRAIQVEEP